MDNTYLPKESMEYVNILSKVFSELVANAPGRKEYSGNCEVTPSLVECLQYVLQNGTSSIGQIADGLSISVPAASQLVDRLVQKRLATREYSEEDRRLAQIMLTDAGKDVVRENIDARETWLSGILARMDDDQKSDLVRSLEEFIRVAVEKDGNIQDLCLHCGIDHLAFCVVGQSDEGEQSDATRTNRKELPR